MTSLEIAPISNSEISCHQRCKRRWYLAYVLWLTVRKEDQAPTGNLQLGFRVHQALELDHKHPQGDGPLGWLDQIYGAEELARLDATEDIRREHALARTMLEGYEAWAAETGLNEGIEVVAAERDVQVPMPGMDGVMVRGRLDQVIRRRSDGVVLFRDWKTTGSLSAANDLIMSQQMRFYTMISRLAADSDARVDGGQVVYILRSKRTARATPPFYALEEVRYRRDDLNSIYLRSKAVITEMLQARERLAAGEDHREVAYASPMASCNWECAFRDVCPLMDGGDRWQDMVRDQFTQENPYGYYDKELS